MDLGRVIFMNNEKIVEFNGWCQKCKYWEKSEAEDPCFECLENPVNVDSRRPVKYEEAEE
jgi:hypothetical protein